MKLSGFKEDYQWFSAKASEVSRQLAFGGIAVIWVFKVDGASGARVPGGLVLPCFLFCVALGADLLQYLVGTLIWGAFHRIHEMRVSGANRDPDILAPAWLNYPGLGLFWAKHLCVAWAYVRLLAYIASLWG